MHCAACVIPAHFQPCCGLTNSSKSTKLTFKMWSVDIDDKASKVHIPACYVRKEGCTVRTEQQELWSASLTVRAEQQELWSTSLTVRAEQQELWSTSLTVRAEQQELWSTSLASGSSSSPRFIALVWMFFFESRAWACASFWWSFLLTTFL